MDEERLPYDDEIYEVKVVEKVKGTCPDKILRAISEINVGDKWFVTEFKAMKGKALTRWIRGENRWRSLKNLEEWMRTADCDSKYFILALEGISRLRETYIGDDEIRSALRNLIILEFDRFVCETLTSKYTIEEILTRWEFRSLED